MATHEPDRAGRYLSATGSTGRPFYAESAVIDYPKLEDERLLSAKTLKVLTKK
jgi:hypothetical protein